MAGNAPDLRLDGVVAVVTGAANGIGAATARMFVELGARAVVIVDVDRSRAENVADGLAEGGAQSLALDVDIRDEQAVNDAAVQVADRFGACDVLVNNAGALDFTPLEDADYGRWKAMVDTNLNGHFLCTRAFGRLMLQQGRGSIVNVTSIAGVFPKVGGGAYSVAKAAHAMLSRQVAVEWGPRGIRSNVVSPGMVETTLAPGLYDNSDTLARRVSMVPVGRVAQADDIATVISFLASPASSYVNGQVINVDGGLTEMLVRMIPHPGVVSDLLPHP
jgi:NAD(P)-dependent dehydrogenase (short-subunit alcohol dehydrogenase family)